MNRNDILLYELQKEQEGTSRRTLKNGILRGGRYKTIIQYYKEENEPFGDDFDVVLYNGDDLERAIYFLEDVNKFDNYLDGAKALYCSVNDYENEDEPCLVDDIYIELF